MSRFEEVFLGISDNPVVDAFARLRVSEPHTLFDNKQIFDNAPLFFDESLVSGAGITSSYSTDHAGTTITSTLNTAGNFVRQSFQCFNYSPGKSQILLFTGVLDLSGGGTGVQRYMGQFNDDDGMFFMDDEGTIKVGIRTSTSGSPVDTLVSQGSWNVDTMDGNGPSGINMNFGNSQLWFIDYEWLGVGRVRFGMFHGGQPIVAHEANHDNVNALPFMSIPNLPVRFEMVTTGSSPASSMRDFCVSLMTEGGDTSSIGDTFYVSTNGTHINANAADTIYAIVAIRLKSTHIGANVLIENVVTLNSTNNDYEWILLLNPTVANAVTFADVTNSGIQSAPGNAGNPSNSTLTGGRALAGGLIAGGQGAGSGGTNISNAIRLGVAIDGTRDEIYLGVRPFGSNLDVDGGMNLRELS